MRNRKREKPQRELLFVPQPRVSLPKGVIREAVGALAAMIGAAMTEADRKARAGGRDE